MYVCMYVCMYVHTYIITSLHSSATREGASARQNGKNEKKKIKIKIKRKHIKIPSSPHPPEYILREQQDVKFRVLQWGKGGGILVVAGFRERKWLFYGCRDRCVGLNKTRVTIIIQLICLHTYIHAHGAYLSYLLNR